MSQLAGWEAMVPRSPLHASTLNRIDAGNLHVVDGLVVAFGVDSGQFQASVQLCRRSPGGLAVHLPFGENTVDHGLDAVSSDEVVRFAEEASPNEIRDVQSHVTGGDIAR